MSDLSRPATSCMADSRCILDAIVFGVAVISRDGTVLVANRAWDRFIDAMAPEFETLRIGGNYLAMLRRLAADGNAFASSGLAALSAVMGGERTTASLEHEVRMQSAIRWFVARATAVGDADGRIVVTHIDMTPHVLGRVALESANERLRQLSERLIAVEQEERRAIALDLHDDVGQS